MWPWAHVAVGYILLAGIRRGRALGPPTDIGTLAVGVGAILPDLIDKTFTWYVPVLPYGRSLAHSLLVAGVFLAMVGYLARETGRLAAFGAFTLGYLGHLAGDAYQSFLFGEWAELSYLVWPLLPPPPGDELVGLIAYLRDIQASPFFLFELGLTVVGIGLWWSHGRPGIEALTSSPR